MDANNGCLELAKLGIEGASGALLSAIGGAALLIHIEKPEDIPIWIGGAILGLGILAIGKMGYDGIQLGNTLGYENGFYDGQKGQVAGSRTVREVQQ